MQLSIALVAHVTSSQDLPWMNWVSLALELVGLSLTALEIYFPRGADSLERVLDQVMRTGLRRGPRFHRMSLDNTWGRTIVFFAITTTALALLAGAPLAGLLLLLVVLAIGVAAVNAFAVGWYLMHAVAFSLSAVPFAMIWFFNRIHPSDRAVGGIGVVISVVGVVMGAYQVAMP